VWNFRVVVGEGAVSLTYRCSDRTDGARKVDEAGAWKLTLHPPADDPFSADDALHISSQSPHQAVENGTSRIVPGPSARPNPTVSRWRLVIFD
jgi:hypothetical protein